MYRIRWNRCSPAETHYLSAMARLVQGTGRDEVTGRQVADLLGREPKELSTIRQRLIDKQLIEATRGARGSIRFTLPFYDRYILERAEQAVRNQGSRWTTRADRGIDL